MYITSLDVAKRLFKKRRHWFHGKPDVSLEGKEKTFGKLKFDFHDEVVEFSIFIQDRERILAVAEMAVENFNELIGECLAEEAGGPNPLLPTYSSCSPVSMIVSKS